MQGVAPVAGRKERGSVRKSRRPFRRALLDEKSTKRSQRSLATSERILDAAEELFAKHGIYGVTMREIAELANVDTALLHYYFDSKRGVFDAVFSRRADILNTERMREFDRYEAENGGHYELESIIAAYLRPMFSLNRQGGQGWRNFCAFVGNLSTAPELAEIFAQKFDPVVKRFMGMLREAMPEASEIDLYWSYHMFSGSLMVVNMANGAIEHLSDGLCHAEDFDEIEPRLVKYSAEGFRRVCGAASHRIAAQ
ncbi:MAG TPA: TetR/AcrR family transcriptional regulator [Rhizomicrobium sp.]|nr:TetR/AcrR family transcriptional regulator [Rhizomicrobium sp.]